MMRLSDYKLIFAAVGLIGIIILCHSIIGFGCAIAAWGVFF